MNVCDSLWIAAALRQKGYTQVMSEKEADVILINTCSVRQKPEQKVYSMLGRIEPYLKNNPNLIVGVGGCVAQQVKETFWEKFPFVRLIFGTDGVRSVPDSIVRLSENPDLKISLLDFLDYYPEREIIIDRTLTKQQAGAYVNIMQGCDNFCAYCIVPFTRGRQKSRKTENILNECKKFAEAGIKEITLLGQNVNSFGKDKYGDGVSFPQLIRKVSKIEGIRRIRFTTSHPKDISDELIALFGELENLCPAIHLPLQSGSNTILAKMGRKYTIEDYLQIVEKLRKVRDDIVITTDLIVGFPTETEEDFLETLKRVKEIEFDSSFSFKYSDRPGTKATKMEPKIPDEIKSERLKRLQNLQDKLTHKSLNKLKGKVVEVLVEGKSAKQGKDNQISLKGREGGGRVVNFLTKQTNNIHVGSLVKVKITEIKKHSLFGEVIL